MIGELGLMNITKARLIVASIVALAGALLMPFLHAPDSAAHVMAMKKALDEFPPPLGTLMLSADEIPRWRDILVERTYKSDLGYDALRQYYRPRLEEKGWRLVEEAPLRDLGRDFGGRDLLFCKRPYAANLQYIGKRVDSGASFILSVSWRLISACDS
jgi:hypothetical protein